MTRSIRSSQRLPVFGSILFFGAAFLLSFAGCKKDQAGKGPSATPVTEVRIAYFANVTHAQAVLGVHSGDFEKAVAPAKLTARTFNAGPELIEALNSGNIDIGYIGPGPALNGFAKSKGKLVRVIAGAAGNGVVIVARPESGITDLKGLAKKKLATPQLANTQDIAAKFYLREILGESDIANVQPTKNAEQAALMSDGKLDASWAPEPWGSVLEAKANAKVIAEEKDIKELWPEGKMGITYVITRPEFLEKYPDAVEKVLAVHVNWTERLNNEGAKWESDLAAALTKLNNGAQLPPGVLAKSMSRTLFTADPLEHTFGRLAQWSRATGFVQDRIDTSGLVDTTILKKVQAARPAPAARAATPR